MGMDGVVNGMVKACQDEAYNAVILAIDGMIQSKVSSPQQVEALVFLRETVVQMRDEK